MHRTGGEALATTGSFRFEGHRLVYEEHGAGEHLSEIVTFVRDCFRPEKQPSPRRRRTAAGGRRRPQARRPS